MTDLTPRSGLRRLTGLRANLAAQEHLASCRRLIAKYEGELLEWHQRDERLKLHWRDRFALWLAKHRRRWERACV